MAILRKVNNSEQRVPLDMKGIKLSMSFGHLPYVYCDGRASPNEYSALDKWARAQTIDCVIHAWNR